MRLRIVGIISIASALVAGVGLYFVVDLLSVVIGVAVLYGVFIALGSLSVRFPAKVKHKLGQTSPAAGGVQNSSRIVTEGDDDGTFAILTVLSFVIGIALGVGVNYLYGESSILTCLGGWIVVQFVAMFLVMVFGNSEKYEGRQVPQGILKNESNAANTEKNEAANEETYEAEALEVEQRCMECGECYCLSLVCENNGKSYIKCGDCFAFQSLEEIISKDPIYLLTILRELYEKHEFQTAQVLLQEILKYQTFEDINSVDPVYFITILRQLFEDEENRAARRLLHEMAKYDNSWADLLATYYEQFERSVGIEYPNCLKPDPEKLAAAFFVMLNDASMMTPKRVEEQVAIYELLLDMYARVELNSIDSLRDYLLRVAQTAEGNGFALAPLNDIAALLEPFEMAVAEFSSKRTLFEKKMDALLQMVRLEERITLLKKRYIVLFFDF